jgi:16S rRNA (cytosine1402-N4)-methyltransferase
VGGSVPTFHTPVLLAEVIGLLDPPAGSSLFVDATLGEGGHAEAFLERTPGLRLVGVEVDAGIAAAARARLARFGQRFSLWRGWFSDYFAGLRAEGEGRPDRVLFDLGVSSYHYAASGRGFSFARDEALDMRLDLEAETTAADLVNGLDERELADLIYRYGEERRSRSIARAIVRERERAPIETSGRLAEVIRGAVPPERRRGRIHPATRCFQALRIAVNGELDRIEAALRDAASVLAPGGRVGVIAFHSLEDRIVKTLFRSLASEDESEGRQAAERARYRLLTRKAVMASEGEVRANPPSRSARLRVLERVVA